MKKIRIALIAGILILIGLLVFSPHLFYRFPIHLDEWTHLGYAENIIDKKGYNEKDLDFTGEKLPTHEVGFHIFLAEISLMTGIDPIFGLKYFAPILAVVTAFLFFVVMLKTTKNFYIGIFSMIFFASLRSNINILGIWFFVPFVFAFPLILGLFYTAANLDNKKFLITSIVILFILYFVHAQAAMLSSIIFLIYLISNYKKLNNNWPFLLVLVAFLLVVLLFYSSTLWNNNLFGLISKIISLITFIGFRIYPNIEFSIILFYGIIPFLLAIVGLIKSIKDKKQRFWIIWVAFTIVLITIFKHYKIIFFVTYRRAFYFTIFALVPLSAVGMNSVLDYLKKNFKNKLSKKLAVVIFIIAVLSFTFSSYYEIPENLKIFYLINESEYEDIMWFGENYGSHNKILAPEWISKTIFPTTRNYMKFFLEYYKNSDCRTKRKIVKDWKIDYVFSKEKDECDFLNQIYNNSFYIYKTNVS